MKKKLTSFLEWLIVFLLSIMLFSVLWGVGSRYLFADQSSWTDELARFMLIWVSIFGAVYISGKNAHIAIDLLPASVSVKNKIYLDIFNAVIIALFVIVIFIIGGIRYVYVSFILNQTSAALGISMGYVYLVLPIAGLIIIFYKILQIKQGLIDLKNIN